MMADQDLLNLLEILERNHDLPPKLDELKGLLREQKKVFAKFSKSSHCAQVKYLDYLENFTPRLSDDERDRYVNPKMDELKGLIKAQTKIASKSSKWAKNVSDRIDMLLPLIIDLKRKTSENETQITLEDKKRIHEKPTKTGRYREETLIDDLTTLIQEAALLTRISPEKMHRLDTIDIGCIASIEEYKFEDPCDKKILLKNILELIRDLVADLRLREALFVLRIQQTKKLYEKLLRMEKAVIDLLIKKKNENVKKTTHENDKANLKEDPSKEIYIPMLKVQNQHPTAEDSKINDEVHTFVDDHFNNEAEVGNSSSEDFELVESDYDY